MKYKGTSIHDTATLRRVLGVLDGMVRKMEGGGRIEIADAAAVLGFLGIVGAERTLVARLEEALKAKKGIEFVQSSRRLSVTLRDYLSSEDNAAGNERAESGGEPELQDGLSRLEQKYGEPALIRSSRSAVYR